MANEEVVRHGQIVPKPPYLVDYSRASGASSMMAIAASWNVALYGRRSRRGGRGCVGHLLAIPLAAMLATLVDVSVRDLDPAEAELSTVLFPARDAET